MTQGKAGVQEQSSQTPQDIEKAADRLIAGYKQFKNVIQDVVIVQNYFATGERDKKNRLKVPIKGCKTWQAFCKKCLDRTPRAVNKAVAAYEAKKSTGGDDGRLTAYNKYAVTQSGYTVATVKSFAVYEIRQGNEKAAGFWMRQLYLAQKTVRVDPWRLLHIHVAEEVGLADLGLFRVMLDLEDNAKRIKNGEGAPDLLPLMLATALLCRAEKSRLGDNMCIYYKYGPTYVPPVDAELAAMAAEENPQPQYQFDHPVFDKHTPEGKAMGRGLEHFLLSGKSQLANPSPIPDFQP